MQVIELPIKHPELFESLGVAQPKASLAFPTDAFSSCMLSTLSGRTPTAEGTLGPACADARPL